MLKREFTFHQVGNWALAKILRRGIAIRFTFYEVMEKMDCGRKEGQEDG